MKKSIALVVCHETQGLMSIEMDYATIIFGSKDEARRLYVLELVEEMEQRNISAHDLDALLYYTPNAPSAKKVLDFYPAFCFAFHQQLAVQNIDDDRIPALTGRLLDPQIQTYVSVPYIKHQVLTEFKSRVKDIHVSFYPPNMDDYVTALLDGRKVKTGYINSVNSETYAKLHVSMCILNSL